MRQKSEGTQAEINVRLEQVKKMITVKETVNWKLCMEKSMAFPQKSKTELLYDPATPFLGAYL